MPEPAAFPRIRSVGLTGLSVSFADRLAEDANRAALAFRAALDRAAWDGVEETSTSLTSAFLRFDPLAVSHAALTARLEDMLAVRDWFAAPLPEGRRFWRVPTVYGGACAPQLAEAAEAAGLNPDAAVEELSARRVRVMTIGFAPGQPYLGELPEHWDIPRQQGLTPRVPEGALVVAIRQFVLFTRSTPTGWRHVGQTAFKGFRPDSGTPFPLRPGDEVQFEAVTEAEFDRIAARDTGGDGGAVAEDIA